MKTLIQTLATEFGLSQQQLADLFGIHYSVVSRIRQGSRHLPAKAVQQASALLRVLPLIENKPATDSSNGMPDLPGMYRHIQELMLDCELEIRKLETVLQNLQQQETQCLKLSALFPQLEDADHITLNERQRRWLEEAKYQQQQRAKNCDATQQWMIDIKLKALRSQLEVYEQEALVIKNQINNP